MPNTGDRSGAPRQRRVRTQSSRRRPRASIEERVAAVSALRGRPDADARQPLLVALSDPSALVVAAAADVIAADERCGFAGALAGAFHRFLPDAVRRDPGCWAKSAVVRALLTTGEHDVALYLAGVRHVQPEPVWGGHEDTAVELRAQSLAGLVRARHPDAAVHVATLLADPERGARVAAAEVAGELEAPVAVPLLRLRVLIGDAEPEVIGACWATLLRLAPAESVPAAAEVLGARSEAESDAIALALGGSRLEAALDPLVAWSERASRSSRQAVFAALTLLRNDRAFAHLADVVARGRIEHATDALRALGPFLYDARLAALARDAVASRGDAMLRELLAELLPRDV